MAVLSCHMEFKNNTGSGNHKRETRWINTWLVQTSTKLDGAKTVLDQGITVGPNPLPRIYDQYRCGNDFDPYSLAKQVDAKRIDNSETAWRVTCEYDNTLDVGQAAENPLDRLPIDTWTFAQFQRPLIKDVNGRLAVNTVGQKFDPAPLIDDSRPILDYTRNEMGRPTNILQYQDAVNSDVFLGFPVGTAKCGITASKRFEGEYRFYEVHYTFHFRWDGWKTEGANQGTMFRPSAGKKPVPLPGNNPAPVFLKQDGTIDDSTVTNFQPYFVSLKGYREVAFGPLNIQIYN